MPNIDEYQALTTLVNKNLNTNGQKSIVFETIENISENIFAFPVSKLLSISSNADFIYEIYYKILDRMIDEHTFRYFLTLLKYNLLSREDLIKDIIKSEECKKKKTKIIFNKESKG